MKAFCRLFFTFVILFLLVSYSNVLSQGYGVNYVKVGYFNPKDVKGGLILGAMFGTVVDEAVDVGIGIDFFRGSNKEETKVGESSIGQSTETKWRRDGESSTTIIPITGQVNVKIPASYSLFYTLGGGVGYEMLWAGEKEYNETGEEVGSESRFYHGFRWIINGGILYKLGSRSSFILEAFYDGSRVSRKEDNFTYKVNPSGFGLRGGIRFGIL